MFCALCLLSHRDRADFQLQPRLSGERENSLPLWGLQLQWIPRGQTEGKVTAHAFPADVSISDIWDMSLLVLLPRQTGGSVLGVGEALGAAGLSVHGDSPFLTTWCARHPTLALSSGDQKAQWVLSGPCPSEGSVGICSMILSSFWALGSPWCPGLVAAPLQSLHHHEASPERLCLFPSDEDTGQIGVGPPCPSVTSPQLNYICSDPVPKEVTLRGSGKNGILGARVQPSTLTCHPELGCTHGVCRSSPSLVHVHDEVPNRGKRGCSREAG